MRTHLAAALGTVVLTAGTLLGAPAAGAHTAAYPSTDFEVTVGNTWTKGTVTWLNRSVVVTGTHKSVSSAGLAYCRLTWAYTYNAADTVQLGSNDSKPVDTACGTSKNFTFTVPANVVGGAGLVRVCLDDGNYKDLLCHPYRRP
ncbi:hypothetical protein G3I60_11610 [Streptomyces sp. SID13666]|uniref:hypothetical protein n=1 Tax=unclassified Streptomyces TaxID=2593676 RepID=UPI0013C17689|nr:MULTISPECIES: hypothetical protein [unclassified Streptomyces]NEA54773.1 hypothetical protein [Streptomyces sp. SID13666]NEA70563.1 hypothetical protein [Streptomyces sp. SID13588]